MRELIVYHRFGPSAALVGPLGVWAEGDEVQVPPRGPKLGDEGLPGFTGIVRRVDTDGAAHVRAELAE